MASFEWIHQRIDTGLPFFAAVHLSSLDADGKTPTTRCHPGNVTRKRADG